MAAALRPLNRFASGVRLAPQAHAGAWLAAGLAGLVVTPLVWALGLAVQAAVDAQAWQSLLGDTQTFATLGMTLWTGLAATLLSCALSAWLLSRSFPGERFNRVVRALPPMLAMPHAAFAIGLVFLVAPSGWLLRALSPWATGFDAPPQWATTQDPFGIGLIAVLVAKEVPFLLWAAATQLQRLDTAARWSQELQVAASFGYAPHRAWWRVLWPQLWPRLAGPVLAVLAYSLTVVDMALVIGPGSPPTLAVLAWQWLLDADAGINAQGAAAAWLLAGSVALCTVLLCTLPRLHGVRSFWLRLRTNGSRGRQAHGATARGVHRLPFAALLALYASVMAALAVGSVSGVWHFPQVWPESLSWQGWQSVAASSRTVWTTLLLAVLSAAAALAWAVAWLECATPAWDASFRRLVYLPLVLPPVLWVVGLHRLSLAWNLDAQLAGLWLAHTLAVLPYLLIALSPAYLGFDARYAQIAATLGRRRMFFLMRVKWPLLKASLWAAFAVGFAVSAAQYLPTVFIGAGRFQTVTTEAVTLASGAQRSLTAAYAWLQWLLPALVFGTAALLGRPRRFGSKAIP
jgi:putative thiamine transport system permease protein